MPVECLGVGSFLTKLWVYILTPLAVIGTAILFVVCSSLLSRKRSAAGVEHDQEDINHRPRGHGLRRQRHLSNHQRDTHDSSASERAHVVPQLKTALLRAAPLCLFVAFLSMPSVTSLAARTFLYQCFDQDSCYLEADYAVRIGEPKEGGDYLGYNSLDRSTVTPSWGQIRSTAWLGLALYPFGQLLVFAVLLRSCRHVILNQHTSDLTQAVAFLFSDFKPNFYAFELLLMATKISLVGLATTFTPAGSILQVVFGLLVALFQLVVLATTQPYKRSINNAMGVGCSLMLVNVFLACLQIKVRDLIETVPQDVTTLLLPLYNM